MKRKTRTEISLETSQVLAIRSRRLRIRAWCPVCAKSVVMVTADEAAIVASVSTRTIYRWVEDGKVHFTEGPEDSLLICLDSLA